MSAFKNFLLNFAKKYRLWADGATDEETRAMGAAADEREYVALLNNMRQLGVTGLNLDVRNLGAYPLTKKLCHQLVAYPQEIIPLMDQAVKDVMVDLASREMERLKVRGRNRGNQRPRVDHSAPPNPSSESGIEAARPPQTDVPDLVEEVETKIYKVLPFGLEKSVNMRDLDPAGRPPI